MSDFDPFEDLEKQENTYARPRKCETMKRGEPYEVTAFKKQLSKFQKDGVNQTFNTVVQYKEHGMKFSTILPTKYNNKPDKWFEAMNKLIAEKKPPSVVFYGTIGLGHEVDILRHGQGIDQEKLDNIMHLEALEKVEKTSPMKTPEQSPVKRSGSSLDNASKRMKLESDNSSQ